MVEMVHTEFDRRDAIADCQDVDDNGFIHVDADGYVIHQRTYAEAVAMYEANIEHYKICYRSELGAH